MGVAPVKPVKNVAVLLRIYKKKEVLEVREGRYGDGKLLYSCTARRIEPEVVREVSRAACFYARNVWIVDWDTDNRWLGRS
jgi:hypothetical protein